MGVGITNALLRGRDGTSGVDWGQAAGIGKALLLSPLFGFALAAVLLFVLKMVLATRHPGAVRRTEGRSAAAVVDPRHPDPDLHAGQLLPWLQRRPEGHGPDHADPDRHGADRLCAQPRAAGQPDRGSSPPIRPPPARSSTAKACRLQRDRQSAAGRDQLRRASTRSTRAPIPRWRCWSRDIGKQVAQYGSLAKVPAGSSSATPVTTCTWPPRRIRFLMKDKEAELSGDRGRDPEQPTRARSTARPSSSRPG